ncbi:MAG: hypothetical protein EBZ77_13705, partial [Chitinophagia bacterium]|nr:hypothetical protein [Chitinophagia bacterium]
MKQVLFSILALSVLFASCTKEVTNTKSRADMLRTGRWRVDQSTVILTGPNGKPYTLDYGKYRKKCIVDNYLKFDSLNRGAVHNGGTSCSIADADSISFQWMLTDNDQNITIYNHYLMIDSIGQNMVYNTTDSVWEWRFDSAITAHSNLIKCALTDFSQSSFVLNYSLNGVWLDTSGGNQGSPVLK